jgi:DNA-directed RNA polymerase subunit M/transcription elongation factor TFIIS
MRHNTQIPLVCLRMFNSAQDLARRRDNSIFTVEHDCHLFQAMSSGFRVCEQYGNECDDKHNDENEIVFPSDAGKCDRIDKDIEEERNVGRSENNGKATCSKCKGPDLSWVRDQKRSKGDIVAGEEDE